MKLFVLSLLLVVAAFAAPIEKKEEAVVEKTKEVTLAAEPAKTEEVKKDSKSGEFSEAIFVTN
jgi:hypothetical protein